MKWEAANWKLRIINYVIDTISIVVIFYLNLKIITITSKYIPFEYSIDFGLLLLLVFITYYLVLETITNRTIGKFITRTKVVSSSGNKPSFRKILIRSIIRIFFIEVFSFFSSNPIGWHDSLSGTKVIVLKK